MENIFKKLIRGNALFFIFILGIGGTFQTGFHITAISSPSPYIQRFINTSWYQRYNEPLPLQTVTLIWSAIVSLFSVGALFGVFSFKFVTGKLGRKKAMIGNNFINITAAVLMLTSKEAKSFEMILIARFLLGIAAGLGGSIHPMYLGESSPKQMRGMMTMTTTAFLSFGKLSGQFLGLSEVLGSEDLWNVLLCAPAAFSVVQLLALPFFPEASTYLLIEKGDVEACRKALQSLWGQADYKVELDEMMAEKAAIKGVPCKNLLELLRDRSVRWQLFTMYILYNCIQFSGISAINIFSYDVLQKADIPVDKIRYVTLGFGVSEVVASIVFSLLIECTGRRPLLCGGFGAMSVLMLLVTVLLNLKNPSQCVPYATAGLFMLFIVCFIGGPSGVTTSLASDCFIQSCRPAAFTFIGIHRWLGFAVIGLVFPFLIEALQSICFVVFACFCLLGSLYSFFFVPETTGKTPLEVSEQFNAITACGRSCGKQQQRYTTETRL